MATKEAKPFPQAGVYDGYCTICGKETEFKVIKTNLHLRETFLCKHCGSMARNRHLAIILQDVYGVRQPYALKKLLEKIPKLNVYNAESSGPVHNILKELPNYFFSEYVPVAGVRSEDLQKLSFKDNSFDLIITQDIFEHIRRPAEAWREICRVLKPGGRHIFTLPCSKKWATISRVDVRGDKDVYVLPKIYHGESTGDRLVYNNFGNDLIYVLKEIGFSTKVYWHNDLDRTRFRIYAGGVFISNKL